MTLASALYEGRIRHRRFSSPARSFSYPIFMTYVDLSELDALSRFFPLLSAHRPALSWFRQSDYLDGTSASLDAKVRDLVEQRGHSRPAGPIRVLTHLRTLGYIFNPVTFYYCFAADAETLVNVVAEVNNTPWGERHWYVLAKHEAFRKGFHVSPFQGMDVDYDWRFHEPGNRLGVHMRSSEGGAKTFDATLSMKRRPLSRWNILRALAMYPLLPLRIIVAIYGQAFRLWVRRAPFFTHPRKYTAPADETV